MNSLQYFRIIQGWSEEELAKKSGLTKETIRNVEEGKTNPSHITRKKIARALRIKEDDIFLAHGEKKKTAKFHATSIVNHPDPDD